MLRFVTMEEVNRLWLFEHLKHSLQLLAFPPEIQLGKFPDFVTAADDLAENFDNDGSVSAIGWFHQMNGRETGI